MGGATFHDRHGPEQPFKSTLVGRTFRFKIVMGPCELDLDLSQIGPNQEISEEAPEGEIMAYLSQILDDSGGSLAAWLSEWDMLPQVQSVEVSEVGV